MKNASNISSGFRKYIGNTLWLASERFLGVLIALMMSVVIARYLGPNDFGLLMFAQSFVALFSSISTLGLNRILERDLVSKNSSIKELFNTSLVLSLIGCTLSYLLLILFTNWREYEQATNSLILIIGLSCFFQINTIFSSYFYSQVKGKQLAIATISGLLFSNSIKILIIMFNAPLNYFALALILDAIVLLPILLFITRKTEAQTNLRSFSWTKAKTLLAASWPYILIIFLVTVYQKVDLIMIKELMDDYSVGQYAAAAKLSSGLYYVPTIILTSLYPALINAKNRDENEYNSRLSNLFSLLFYVSIAVSITISLVNNHIVNFLYGADYSKAIAVLKIHVWSSVFVYVGVCGARWLLTENLQKLSIINTLLGALLNITLNFYLIPRHGIVGAAWATLISYFFSGYLCFFLWKSTRPLFYLITRSIFKLPKLRW